MARALRLKTAAPLNFVQWFWQGFVNGEAKS